MGQTPEIVPVAGAELVGPFPADPGRLTVFSAGTGIASTSSGRWGADPVLTAEPAARVFGPRRRRVAKCALRPFDSPSPLLQTLNTPSSVISLVSPGSMPSPREDAGKDQHRIAPPAFVAASASLRGSPPRADRLLWTTSTSRHRCWLNDGCRSSVDLQRRLTATRMTAVVHPSSWPLGAGDLPMPPRRSIIDWDG